MKKPQGLSLEDRLKDADRFWDKIYKLAIEKRDLTFIAHAMDQCNKLEQAVMDERHQQNAKLLR